MLEVETERHLFYFEPQEIDYHRSVAPAVNGNYRTQVVFEKVQTNGQ